MHMTTGTPPLPDEPPGKDDDADDDDRFDVDGFLLLLEMPPVPMEFTTPLEAPPPVADDEYVVGSKVEDDEASSCR